MGIRLATALLGLILLAGAASCSVAHDESLTSSDRRTTREDTTRSATRAKGNQVLTAPTRPSKSPLGEPGDPTDAPPEEGTKASSVSLDLATETAQLPFTSGDVVRRFSAQSSARFDITADHHFELTLDRHTIPMEVEIRATFRVLPTTGEYGLAGTFTLNSAGQKTVAPLRMYVLKDDTSDTYTRYRMTIDHTWEVREGLDPASVIFHPDYLDDHYLNMTSEGHGNWDPAFYSTLLTSDLLRPLLASLTEPEHVETTLPARVEIDTDTMLPERVVLEADTLIGQLIVNNYGGEDKEALLTVDEGWMVLENFVYNDLDELPIPQDILIHGPGVADITPIPTPATEPDDNPITEDGELPEGDEPEVTPGAPLPGEMTLPDPMDEEDWASLGEPLMDADTEEARLDDARILDILDQIEVTVHEVASGDKATYLQPHVHNGSAYVLQNVAVTYLFDHDDIKISTDGASIMPDDCGHARLMEGDRILPDMVTDGHLDHEAITVISAYLIDRDEQITLITANRREDGTWAVQAAGDILRLGRPTEDILSLLPRDVTRDPDNPPVLLTTIVNDTDRTLTDYELLLRNNTNLNRFRLSFDEPLAPGEMLKGLPVAVGELTSLDALTPLYLTVQSDGDYRYYDFRLGRTVSRGG